MSSAIGRAILPAVLVVFTVFSGPRAVDAQQLDDAVPSLAPMIEEVSPGVVNIAVRGTVEQELPALFQDPFFRRFFNIPDQPQRREVQAAGSGVVFDADNGYIVTNNHVVVNADEIVVVFTDRRRVTAEIVGTDPQADLAVLKVEAQDLREVPLGDSDALKVGDFVVAIGNPFGIGQTATMGMVSALQRSGLGIEGYENFIQTDASINPGNSGGALVDQQGNLVGVNTAILSRSGGNIGIGFAIPVNMVKSLVDQIVEYGSVQRGQLGVMIQDLTPDIAEAMDLPVSAGALVTRVLPDTPAVAAGLESGDVVTSVNGRRVETGGQLRTEVGLLRPGSDVTLEIYRGDQQLTLRTSLAEAETDSAPGQEPETRDQGRLQGAEFSALPEEHSLFGEVEGVLLRSLPRESRLARAGLRPGDVVLSVNRQATTSVAELERIVNEAGDQPLLFSVRRGQGAQFIVVN